MVAPMRTERYLSWHWRSRQVTALSLFFLMLAVIFFAAPHTAGAQASDPEFQSKVLHSTIAELEQRLDQMLNLNGYFDFEYFIDDKRNSPSHFRQHHVSLFLSKRIGRWRIFTELEFEDGADLSASGSQASGNGTIKMEHGWAEFALRKRLDVRVGKILLPQYWNVNHYPSSVLSTHRPLMVRKVFPADTTGLMVQWRQTVGLMGSTVNLYVGNGQSPDSSRTDDNVNKATGGNLRVHLDRVFSCLRKADVGVGHYSEFSPSAGGTVDVTGVDLQLSTRRFELLAEGAFTHSGNSREGFYLQPSTVLSGELRSFYRYDSYDSGISRLTRHTVGLNYRPMPQVTVKLEGNHNRDSALQAEEYLGLATSVALFF